MKRAHIAIRLTVWASSGWPPLTRLSRLLQAERRMPETSGYFPRAFLYWQKRAGRQPLRIGSPADRILFPVIRQVFKHYSYLHSTFISQFVNSMQAGLYRSQMCRFDSQMHNMRPKVTNYYRATVSIEYRSNAPMLFIPQFPKISAFSTTNNALGSQSASMCDAITELPFDRQPNLPPLSIQTVNPFSTPRINSLELSLRSNRPKVRSFGATISAGNQLPQLRKPVSSFNYSAQLFLYESKAIKPKVAAINKPKDTEALVDRSSGSIRVQANSRESARELTFADSRIDAITLAWRKSLSTSYSNDSEKINSQHNTAQANLIQHEVIDLDIENRIVEKVTTQTRAELAKEFLSGPTVDRLMDDVMRRIDKRLRIERERRGL
jgi:hypothetical protein